MKRCSICIMPEAEDHVMIDTEGVCSICRRRESVDRTDSQQPEAAGFEALQKKTDEVRTVGEAGYDSLVALSGGKDSTMTLYVARRKLGLNPLAVFVDNGFCCDEMYDNVRNATEVLGVDLIIYRPHLIKELFTHLLRTRTTVYFCRICNALIDLYVRQFAVRHGIGLLLGGHTKGQDFFQGKELFWIYRRSDRNLLQAVQGRPEFAQVFEMFESLAMYFYKNFQSVVLVPPFHYISWDEQGMIDILSRELKFKLPRISWPEGSTNCLFNVVSQHLAVRDFGYSQHEVELSMLVRNGELSRQRALQIIETPMPREHLELALEKAGLTLKDIE